MRPSRFGNRNRQIAPATAQSTTSLFEGLVFESVLCSSDGYGNSAQELCLEIGKRINYVFTPSYVDKNYLTTSDPELLQKVKIDGGILGKKFVQFAQPKDTKNLKIHKNAKVETFLFTMFESTKLPKDWPAKINENYNNLIVPSQFCKQVFEQNGVKLPIFVSPLAVNTSLWPYFDRKTRPKQQPFTFLMLFARHGLNDIRKNSSMVLSAFKNAFGDREDVRLVVKSSLETKIPEEFVQYEGNVTFMSNVLSSAEMLSLYKSADAFLFPSLGEGFGLPPREAMATGLPTILTNWGGMTDIGDEAICYPIQPVNLQPAIYGKTIANSANGGNQVIGEFAKILESDLVAAMLRIFENQNEAYEKGKLASQFIHENFSYKNSVDSLLQIINDGSIKENKELGRLNAGNRKISAKQKVNINAEKGIRDGNVMRYSLGVSVGQIPESTKAFCLKVYAIKKKTGEISKDHPILSKIKEYKLTSSDSFFDRRIELEIDVSLLKFDDYSLLYGLYQDDVKWHDSSIIEIKL